MGRRSLDVEYRHCRAKRRVLEVGQGLQIAHGRREVLGLEGPRGAISQAWMSRADQSLNKEIPKKCSSACASPMRSPSGLPTPT